MFRIHGWTIVVPDVVISARRPAIGRRALICALVSVAMLAFTGKALAVSGTPINVGTPFSITALQDAVDSSGTAYVVWANDKDLAPTTTNVVQYCVIPAGATGCSHTGTLTPAGGASHVDNVQVLVDGSTIVIVADVYGASTTHFEPEQEWQSTDGGATFTIVNGGLSVANAGNGSSLTSALVVPGTNTLGYSAQTAGQSGPTFNEFPLTSPPECSQTTCPNPFAVLEPPSNPDQTGNGGGQFASQLGTSPGVLGIVATDNTNGPFACSNAATVPFGTAFAYGSGAQSATNSYNISPGLTNSAWRTTLAQADCNVDYFAVGGGPSGFGVLEDNEATGSIVYHKFNQAAGSFAGNAEVTINAGRGEQQPAVSQDGAGGVYGTFLLGGVGGPIDLAYSANGGASWIGPATLNPNADTGAHDTTSAVGTSGQGWATWIDNGSIYVQQFVATDAIPPVVPAVSTVTTQQTAGTTQGTSITVPAGTTGEADRATVTGVNAAGATGTMAFDLFSKSSCTAASKVTGSTAAVTGGVAFSSGVTAALAPGTYYWQASYSGNATNLPSASTCGSETLTVVPAASAGGTGSSNGTTVTITVSCASTPCTVTVTITIDPVSHSARATGLNANKKKPKIITIASGTFKIKKAGKDKLAVKLTKAGKKLLKADHGHLKATELLSLKVDGHLEKIKHTIKITTAKKR